VAIRPGRAAASSGRARTGPPFDTSAAPCGSRCSLVRTAIEIAIGSTVNGLWRCRLDPPKLDYASRHRNAHLRLWKALALRHRLGASRQLFSPVVVSLRSRSRLKLLMELRSVEAGLSSLATENATTLEKRHTKLKTG
jgi:hypothetical protein